MNCFIEKNFLRLATERDPKKEFFTGKANRTQGAEQSKEKAFLVPSIGTRTYSSS
jgi:hypothetical protein